MPSLKNRISSPLEAGTSILDAHHLPPHLDAALEYASKRLERKGLRVTLVVVRREYQLHRLSSASSSASTTVATADSTGHSRASSVSSTASQQYASPSVMSPPATPASVPSLPTPSRTGFGTTIKSLVRSGTHPVLPSLERANAASFDLQRSQTISPALSCASFSSVSSVSTASTAMSTSSNTRFRWPMSPPLSAASTSSSMPMTPATPATPATTVSSCNTDTTSTTGGAERSPRQGTGSFGIRLVHATFLPPRHERIVRQTIEKAERKFDIGADWLSPALSASSLGLSPTLIRRSLQQNEILFRSASSSPNPACTSPSSVPKSVPGLTLIALDHLYTFKAALAAYSASSRCPYRLEDAVDELRRFVLANGTEKLKRSSLARTYDLTFGDAALKDVERMYRRAYGGIKQEGGIEWDEGESPARSDSVRTAKTSVSSIEKELQVEILKHGDDCDTEFEDDEDDEEKVIEEISEKMFFLDETASTPPAVTAITPPPTSQSAQRGPLLKLKTTFDEPLPTRRRPQKEIVQVAENTQEEYFNVRIDIAAEEDDEEEEERTARPIAPGMAFWNSMSIDEVLGADTKSNHRRSSLISSLTGGTRASRQGPMTPNGYDDISPITRGEWGFLMGDQMGKQCTITTC